MENFNTSEKVQSLFNNAIPNEEWSAFFVGYKDMSSLSSNPAVLGGFVAGAVNAQEYPYDAMLVALGKNGIAYFPLQKTGIFKTRLKDFNIETDKCEYIPFNLVDKIVVKKFPIGKKMKFRLRTTTGKDHRLFINGNEDLSYQEAGINELVSRFGKR